MKKIILVCLMIFLVIAGCSSNKEEVITNTQDNRFILIYKQVNDISGYIEIFQDKETGKKYMFRKSGYGGGLTELSE